MFKRGLIAFILIAAAGAAFWFWRSSRAEEAPDITTVDLGRGDITQSVTATGTIQPVTSVEVSSQISGLVNAVLVDFNTPVKKGDVLARIDPATYQQRLRQAEADLAASKANENLVAVNAKRTRVLFEKQWVTQQDLDQAEAQLEQAKADVQTKEATVENAKVDLSRCTIYSPIDGIVMDREVDPGRTVAASLNAPLLFVIANQLSEMEIDAAVAEADVGNVRDKQAVDFTVDAYPNRHFNGSVIQVRNNPKTASNVVTYDTMISVKNEDLKLKSGMTANVSIVVARHRDALRIPNAALRARVPEELVTDRAPEATAPSMPAPTAPGTRPMSADERRRAIWQILREVGVTRGTPPSPDQIAKIQQLAKERGVQIDMSRFGGGSGSKDSSVTTRTVYVLLPSADPVRPRVKAVQINLGITDGIYTEVLEGLKEGDKVITSASLASDSGSSNPMNPFSRFRRR